MRKKAVRFLRDVLGDRSRAEEFETMTPEEYAEHKRVTIENPRHQSGHEHVGVGGAKRFRVRAVQAARVGSGGYSTNSELIASRDNIRSRHAACARHQILAWHCAAIN
jgi:hypothetical protein